MSTVTEVQETSGALTYGGAWTTNNTAVASGGSLKFSPSGSGTLTYTFSGRALYLVSALTSNSGAFTVTIDGVAQGGVFNCQGGGALTIAWRVLVPLARGLSDGSHTVVLTVTAGLLYVDSFLVVTGTRSAAGTGALVCLGDSWVLGTGATSATLTSYPARLCTALGGTLQRAVTLTAKGVAGDCYCANGNGGTQTGAMYRLFADAYPAAPEFLTLQFGTNDLHGTAGQNTGFAVGLSDMARFLHAALCFIEDVWDTTGATGAPVRVAVATPAYTTGCTLVCVPATVGQPADSYAVAPHVVASIVAQFPWCRLADLWGAMDHQDGLLYPNSNSDLGLHPNDIGHGVVAAAFARALLS